MKKDKLPYILFIGIFSAVSFTPSCLLAYSALSGNMDKENAPVLIENNTLNKSFSEEAEKYMTEIMPARNSYITAISSVRGLFGTGSEKVITGKNGMLFYRDEVSVYTGISRMSDRESFAAAKYLSLLNEYCQKNGTAFLFAAAPDKAGLYSEYLPYYADKIYKSSDLDILHSHLSRLDVKYTDLYDILDESSPDFDYYLKTDTHWNDLGAITAWNAMMNTLGRPHSDYSGAAFSLTDTIQGDLTAILYPASGLTEPQYHIAAELHDDIRFTRPNQIDGNTDFEYILDNLSGSSERYDFIIEAKCPSAENDSLVMRRDSFGRALLPYFTDSYRSSYFTRSMTISSAELNGAEDFIYEIAERNLGLITSEACYIPSPERNLPDKKGTSLKGTCTADMSYDMPLLSGELDSGFIDNNPQADIIAVLTGEGVTLAFEAYPINEYGFAAYIDRALVPKGEYDISLYAAGEYTEVLCSISL